MDVSSLNENFGLPGVLAFDEPHPGMARAVVTTPACTAELYLQGAHLTQWRPASQAPVLFLSERSLYAPGKAIRGGIPVIFPWFGSPSTSPVNVPEGAPSHGFARTSPWTLQFAALAGENLHLTLALEPDLVGRAFGFGDFQLVYQLILGRTLTLRLTTANIASAPGAQPFLFEEALHTYFAVSDARQIEIAGLGNTDYLDKTDSFQRKRQTEPTLTLDAETDRPYLDTTAAVTLHDRGLNRRISVSKANSRTTVIWNPWSQLAARLADLEPGAWTHFTCIEAANAAANAVNLRPREARTMEVHIALDPLEAVR